MKRINIITLLTFASLSVGAFAMANNGCYVAKAIDTTTVEKELAGVSTIKGYNSAQTYLMFNIKNSDYQFDYNNGNDFPVYYDAGKCVVDYTTVCNFYTNCKLNGESLSLLSRPVYLKYKANDNTIAIEATEEFSSLKEGDTLFIPGGTTFPSYGLLTGANNNLFTISNDTTYKVVEGQFRKEVVTTKSPTKVNSLEIIPGYNSAQKYLIVSLSNNDYDDVVENNKNDYNLKTAVNSFKDFSSFGYKIELNNEKLNLEDRFIYLNYYAHYGAIGIEFTDIAGGLSSLDKITIKQGTTFPSYAILKDNGNTVYEADETITFTYFDSSFHVCTKATDGEALHNESEHWYKCYVCNSELEHVAHTFVKEAKAPTCTEDGFEEGEYCSVCGYVKTSGASIPATGHDYTNAPYEYDDEGHWQNCKHECGEHNEKVAHTFEAGSKTCSVCGYSKDICFVTVVNGYTFDGNSEYAPNSEVTVIANTPEDGYKFYGWYMNGEPVGNTSTYTFEIKNDVTLEAKYTKDNKNYGEPDILNGENKKEDKKGCGGSIVASSSILLITSVIGLSLLCKKKKED